MRASILSATRLALVLVATFAPTARAGEARPPSSVAASSVAASSVAASSVAPPGAVPFVVALDPGHGGSNLGTVGAGGLPEKDVTLALARQLGSRLEAVPGVRVVLCRDKDVLVPIRARSRCAAESRADLFLSLHANATPAGVAPGSQRGFELYVLPPEDVEDDAALAALGAPGAAGVWAAHGVRAAAPRSLEAARAIDLRLRRALGERLARGIRQSGAALDVLRDTRAPGVLVEIGFLDSDLDRAVLASPAGRDRLADALAGAVLDVRAAALR
jgi:N-acetylmuramoyl-L-alanine amidase